MEIEITTNNIEEYENKIIRQPIQHLSNQYTTSECGGSNLTIGEMVKKAKETRLYGGKCERLTIRDNSENKLYIINF